MAVSAHAWTPAGRASDRRVDPPSHQHRLEQIVDRRTGSNSTDAAQSIGSSVTARHNSVLPMPIAGDERKPSCWRIAVSGCCATSSCAALYRNFGSAAGPGGVSPGRRRSRRSAARAVRRPRARGRADCGDGGGGALRFAGPVRMSGPVAVPASAITPGGAVRACGNAGNRSSSGRRAAGSRTIGGSGNGENAAGGSSGGGSRDPETAGGVAGGSGGAGAPRSGRGRRSTSGGAATGGEYASTGGE